MKKSHLILIIVLIILAVTIGVLYVVSLNSKKTQQVEEKSNQTPETLPNGTSTEKKTGNSLSGKPLENLLQVQSSDDSNQIKNAYEKYLGDDSKNHPYYETDGVSDVFSPSDKNINLIPITKFFNAISTNLNSGVASIIGTKYYGLFYCINEKKQKEYGIAFDLSDEDSVKSQSNYQNAKKAMSQWEPYLLKDLHNLLFPSINLDQGYLNQELAFKDGQYRYSEINLPGEKKSIDYSIVNQPLYLIIITSSPSCINKAIGLFSALD